ncbi:P-loop containing nucleoside triphosphate hydrolase protein [Fimicolochytrium jonesii]|uniref:P-loop containing nucleoside triphosphate hydrolase protein n=1 Tax=Fimicolochytrium jonesii TaxID=1396493 RepID=UPI0022FEA4FE|nr:P-loop containing nucleoside triphosphate hydrolase protein [Fimicolochytrium jonesii]KAI8823403.1 P-loop containing nucleoside triphosphate hydrolase protein [Fimicolochytrium jonesii]
MFSNLRGRLGSGSSSSGSAEQAQSPRSAGSGIPSGIPAAFDKPLPVPHSSGRTGLPTPSPSPISALPTSASTSSLAPKSRLMSPSKLSKPPSLLPTVTLTSAGGASSPGIPKSTSFNYGQFDTQSIPGAGADGESDSISGDACQVVVRMRPLTHAEENAHLRTVWDIDHQYNRVSLSAEHAEYSRKAPAEFYYDAVLWGSDNKDLYEASAKSVVRSAMEGYNGTVFAYGQTASGKTYSMMGLDEQPGVIPQAVDEIFAYIREQSADREYLLRVSYMEIYNETIRDLLSPEQTDLRIHEDRKRGVFVSPLKEEIVTNPRQVMRVIRKGEENRHFGATDYNEHSSRSHTIFQMVIESRERGQSGTSTPTIPRPDKNRGTVTISQLNLIDLAGSEKATTDTDRRKEGAFINKSLLTLGTVISKLTDGKAAAATAHIPYRDSKLTRILQSSLSGNARISVICTISPSANNTEETQNTLKFASRVKKVTVNAHANRVVDEKALLQKYKQEIEELRQQLSATNELLERERRQQQTTEADNDRKRYEEELMESQIASTAMKERLDHLTNLILTSKTITKSQLLDWSAPTDPQSHRNSVMMEDGLLPSSPNMNAKRTASTTSPNKLSPFNDKEFLKRHIREIDQRDEKIRQMEFLVMQLKAATAKDGNSACLRAIEMYEMTSGKSVESVSTLVAERDKAVTHMHEVELLRNEMEERIRDLEATIGDSISGDYPAGPSATDLKRLTDNNRALKLTIKNLRAEMEKVKGGSGSRDSGDSSSSSRFTKELQQTISKQREDIESLQNELASGQRTIQSLRDSIRMLELSNDMFVQSASRANSPTPGSSSANDQLTRTRTQSSQSSEKLVLDLEGALERERKLRGEENRTAIERIAGLEAELACMKAELGVLSLVGGYTKNDGQN